MSVNFGTKWDEVKSNYAKSAGRGRDEVIFYAQIINFSRDEVGRGQMSVITHDLPLHNQMNQDRPCYHQLLGMAEAASN